MMKSFLLFVITTLHKTNAEQCTGEFCNGEGAYCAVGILLHTLGMSDKELCAIKATINDGDERYSVTLAQHFKVLGYSDATADIIHELLHRNDETRDDFDDIAYALAERHGEAL